jgi:tRNA pseudouridine55 synthase
MARRRRQCGRPVNGILLLDKPIGLTSNAALQQVKRLFGARKAGHTGSLDPLATGMLPICFGEATKLSGFLLDSDKHYQAEIQLGIRTRTGDAEGEVIEQRDAAAVTRAMVDEVLVNFNGTIEQIPPMYSALKQNGQPLYKLAHQGIEVEREARKVTIHALEVAGFDAGRLSLSVHCSKGTYIRTLAEDIGEQLGCGAHIAALRRDGVGTFSAERVVTLAQLEALEGDTMALDALLMGPDLALLDWPEIQLGDDVAYFLKRGQPVLVPKAPGHGFVRVYGHSRRFLGVGHILDDGRLAPKRLLNL